MKEKLVIQNFGPIRDIELNNIQRFLILIGESGSGKSTILKVLSLCRWIYKQQNIRAYLHNANVTRSPFRHNINGYLNTSGLLEYVKKGSLIKYERDGVSICIEGELQKRAKLTVTEPAIPQLCWEKVCFIAEKRNTLPDLIATRTSEKYAGYYVMELFREFKRAQEYIKEMKLSSVDVRFRLEKKNGNEKWKIENLVENAETFSIDFEDASSGIQSSAPVDMLLNYFSQYYDIVSAMNTSVVEYLGASDSLKNFRPDINVGEVQNRCVDLMIEEPEMCLFPNNQIRFISSLIQHTFADNSAFVIRTAITTHSPYILNYMNLLFKAYDKGQKINEVNLSYDDIDVYAVKNGGVLNLKVKNAHLVNPEYLAQPIDEIYDMYELLNKKD